MTLEEAIEQVEMVYKEHRSGWLYALKRGETIYAERCKKSMDYNRQLVEWLRELSRARTLLKATHELLETAKKSPYVLDTLSIVVHYDEADCDGNCLKEDIENYFDEYGEDGDAE